MTIKRKPKAYVGIDLGLNGGIAVVDERQEILLCIPMHVNDILVNKKIKQQYDIKQIIKTLDYLESKYSIAKVCFERLRGMPAQSSQTGFSLGYAVGLFRGLLTKMGLVYEEVEPRTWQKIMFEGINYGKEDTKIASAMVANRLYPNWNFKKSSRAKKDHDGMTDAILIAVFISKK